MGFQHYFEELPFHPLSLLPLLLLIFLLIPKHWLSTSSSRGNPPPSPPKLPIIGNLHQLGKLPHRSLRSLSDRYGDLMLLHLGTKPTLVVSSANAAREVMKTHDIIFSNRPRQRAASRIMYGCKDVGFSSYGEYWRQMKSICVVHLLSNNRVLTFRAVREEEVGLLVDKLEGSSCTSSVVNLNEVIITFMNEVVCRVAFGKKYSNCGGSGEDGGIDFKEMLKGLVEVIGFFSVGDFIPWLSWIDRVSGFDSRVEKVAKDFDEFLDKVIGERRDFLSRKISYIGDDEGNLQEEKVNNIVDVLLQLQTGKEESLSTDSIKAVILDMFAAGTETNSTLLVWAMTELLRHPKTMIEVQKEVREIVRGKTSVTENDLHKMSYLKAVIKETLRLHPPAPLLMPRESSCDVKLNDYHMAAKTRVIINAWAIQRDPTSWYEPEEFRPERFLNSSVDFKGHDFEFIPFGAGRRGCPGISFSLAISELVLATLVYKFDWKIAGDQESQTLNVTESAGLTAGKRDPLMMIAIPYHSCK